MNFSNSCVDGVTPPNSDPSKKIRPDRRFTVNVDFDSMDPYYDRITEHLIQLRPYLSEMRRLVKRRQRQITLSRSRKAKNRKIQFYIPPEPTFPDFPSNFPFEGTLEDKDKIRIVTSFPVTEVFVREQMMKSVKRIVASLGYVVDDLDVNSEPLLCLTQLACDFLKRFAELLRKVNNSGPRCGSNNLWNPLETVLQRIGYDGIKGLHYFYLEGVIKRHERVFQACLDYKSQYEELKKVEL